MVPTTASVVSRPRPQLAYREQAWDTGLGFLEYDSPSSSEGDEIRAFDEVEDSSGSDSDATIIPSIKGGVCGSTKCSENSSTSQMLQLKSLDADCSWVKLLDSLPEDQDEDECLDSSSAVASRDSKGKSNIQASSQPEDVKAGHSGTEANPPPTSPGPPSALERSLIEKPSQCPKIANQPGEVFTATASRFH